MKNTPPINRRGTPPKRKTRKASKRCAECGRSFATHERHIQHLVAHRAAEEMGTSLAWTEEQARAVFKEMKAGRGGRQRGGGDAGDADE